jgi:branched-chain amino acid transport system ATP-binding protein
MLRVENLSVAYGGLHALSGVSLEVGESGFVAIVGPNGAGKTTLFRAISGTTAVLSGRILLDGTDITTLPPAERPHLGIAHVPEGRKVFGAMSVIENLEMGATTRAGQAAWPRNLPRILDMFPRLAERRRQLAGTLSGGEQQMLAIGRGLAAAPRLLMLDEPSMGLSPSMADSIFDSIKLLHDEWSLAVLLVEQRVAEAIELCDHGYVLETGRIVLQGSVRDLSANDRIREAYLGM